MRKHQYKIQENNLTYKCIYCGRTTGLDSWQIQSMPMDMAKCNSLNSPRIPILKVWFKSGIDCFIK